MSTVMGSFHSKKLTQYSTKFIEQLRDEFGTNIKPVLNTRTTSGRGVITIALIQAATHSFLRKTSLKGALDQPSR